MKFWLVNLKVRIHVGDLSVDERIISNIVIRKSD